MPGHELLPVDYDFVGLGDGSGRVVDPATGEVLGTVPNAPANKLLDDSTLAQALDDGTVVFYEYPSGVEQRTLTDMVGVAGIQEAGGSSTFSSLDLNRELGLLTGVTRLGAVGTWDTETWEFELRWAESDIRKLAYHPEGRYAVTSDEGGTIHVRDPETLEPLGEAMTGHTAAVGVFENAFSFFGERYLVSMGQDQTLRLWDVETRAQVGDPLPTSGAAAFAAQPAQWLVATATDDQFLLWNYHLDQWTDIACQAAGRNLTVEEWDQYGPRDEPYHQTCSRWPAQT